VSAVAPFDLPSRLEAREPPEARGLRRDEVRMLVAGRPSGRLADARVLDLPAVLAPGDLLVVNTSATLPAALPARRADGTALALHVSTELPDSRRRLVELRRDGAPFRGGEAGERLALPGGGAATLVAPYVSGCRLWVADLRLPGPLVTYLARHGRPIRYRHVPHEWPIEAYQTVFATEPGSAEMPSASRPFTDRVVASLVRSGVLFAPLVLHTGVSSLERGEAPYLERYAVPEETARLVNAVRWWGGRVIAVGTTVVRALETVAGEDGTVVAAEGWTRLVVTPERGLRTVDGLITGWHEPEASHLLMLEAVAGQELLEASYAEAVREGYRWHEFGDSHLVLP
jgi:S-adenosylmethionine:tRNA ribosyltransferase-isomerase